MAINWPTVHPRGCQTGSSSRNLLRSLPNVPTCPSRRSSYEHKEFSEDKKRCKNRLFMTCLPKRQVDVEVIHALGCVAACQVRQPATVLVRRENRALDQDETVKTITGRNRPWAPAMGIATMHPAKKSHIAVCRIVIPTRMRVCFDCSFMRLQDHGHRNE
jgi:hypothetical protein